ncbi:MAG TPA: MBL fold metallo-hydrolase [Patescibacteria group bacterium]|nr:MBL fold metallo-hydrolase [Patescibacteria group bacterium]
MTITWLGHSCFKIQDKEITVITDPYDRSIGFKMPRVSADIVTASHDHLGHHNISEVNGVNGNPFIISAPGEYEVKGVFVYGTSFYHDKSEGKEKGKITAYKIEMDDIFVFHLGDIGHILSDEQIAKIGKVDILLIPVGGVSTIGAKEATEIINQLEPRIVIPMHYKVPGLKFELEPLDKFLKEVGATKAESMPKLKISKKELPQDETKFILLENN